MKKWLSLNSLWQLVKMNNYNSVLRQLLSFIPRDGVVALANKYGADFSTKKFYAFNHLVSLVFAHFKGCYSLRDISSEMKKVSILGLEQQLFIKNVPSGPTLSRASLKRSWYYFRDVYYLVETHIHKLMNSSPKKMLILEFTNPLEYLELITLETYLNLFDFTKFQKLKGPTKDFGAFKLNFRKRISEVDFLTLRSLRLGHHPVLLYFPNKFKLQDDLAKALTLCNDSFVIFESFCKDSNLLNPINEKGIRYIIQLFPTKEMDAKIPNANPYIGPLPSLHFSKIAPMILSDVKNPQTLPGISGNSNFRVIKLSYGEYRSNRIILTNDLDTSSVILASSYVNRKKIFNFYNSLHHRLYIRSFFFSSANAILCQLYCAMTAMLILDYVRCQSGLKWSLGDFLAFLPQILLDDIDIFQWAQNQKALPFE
ncbi:MAG: DUF4372 domain-containing protein [Deltaproteobacteria bacterium]|nr:DUF4372 domain-containing protein [Deltaproteobacteria bacterium]